MGMMNGGQGWTKAQRWTARADMERQAVGTAPVKGAKAETETDQCFRSTAVTANRVWLLLQGDGKPARRRCSCFRETPQGSKLGQ